LNSVRQDNGRRELPPTNLHYAVQAR
jgi:hypothetical protein